jgi:uncharacterized protein (TIGR01777 family)
MSATRGKVLISGASGLVGSALVRAGEANQIQTWQLVRRNPAGPAEIQWDPNAPAPIARPAALEGLTAAIHLSGANVAGHRWTTSYKREIVDSRVKTTRALVNTFRSLKQPPPIFLCASATGIYGNRGDEILTEDSKPGSGFLADTCLAWEVEAAQARALGIRVVHLRFGIVLAREGGALKKMLPLFRLGLGGNLGSGRQWMSWIALPDLVRAVFYLLNSPAAEGPFNIVSPNPVINADFTRTLGQALHRPAIVPAPAFALRLAFGEMADEGLLASARVLPDRLLKGGFTFDSPDLASALRAIL